MANSGLYRPMAKMSGIERQQIKELIANSFSEEINLNQDETMKISDAKADSAWWDACGAPYYGGGSFEMSWVRVGLDTIALAGGPTRMTRYKEGAPTKPVQYYVDALVAAGGKLINSNVSGANGEVFTKRYVWPNAGVQAEFDGDACFELLLETNSQALYDTLAPLFDEFSAKPPAGRVNVMVSTQYGPEFQTIGIGGHNIVRDNYEPQVLEAFDKIIADLKSDSPAGRLSIFNGPPGTGKTYLIKAILQAADNSICVIVPSNMLQELSTPSVIPSLIELRKSKGKDVPLVFLVEDADECLVSRADGNMSAISAVLNLCDGIIGSLLDIRIITTTNAEKMQLDKALTRPGRLSANVEVGPLPIDQCLAILARLTGNPDATLPENRKFTLAEIYNLAKDGSVRATGVQRETKGRMGFGA